jgi:CSLREA domain-containing protein
MVLTMAAALTAACLSSAAAPAYASRTFIVNSTGDKGDFNHDDERCFTGVRTFGAEVCTLRAAIEQANATAGADNIHFSILAFREGGCDNFSGVCTITPASGLPFIEDPVTIDGYTQAGASENSLFRGSNADLRIVLSGAKAPVDTSGALEILTSNVTVRGLVINRWAYRSGMWIDGRDRSQGPVTADGNKVEGNFIGTDASGTQDLGNGIDGVSLFEAHGNTVGGTSSAARNVVSGNRYDGVGFEGSTNNNVQGNLIGTTASGRGALGNGSAGVGITRASNNTVGGIIPAARNIISGNGVDGGVIIYGDPDFASGGNKIQGNLIGTSANGIGALGNDSDGVSIVDTSGNTIGGSASARNVVAFNQDVGVGVYVSDYLAHDNSILFNSIHSNDKLGIDLVRGLRGATPNDPQDLDTGPNGFQNKPVLSSAATTGSTLTIKGNLNSTPNTTFTLQFFSNPSGDEGKTFLTQKSVITNANGNASFTFNITATVPAGQTITATATGVGDTSEFSASRTAVAQ